MFESMRSDGATNEGTLVESSVKRENRPNCEKGRVGKLPKAGREGKGGRKKRSVNAESKC